MQFFKDGDYQKASDAFSKAIDVDEQDHKAWNALGVTLSKIGNKTSAENCFETATLLNPGNITYEKNRDKIRGTAPVEVQNPIQSEPSISDTPTPITQKKESNVCDQIKGLYSILIGLGIGMLVIGFLIGANASPIAIGFTIFALIVLGVLYVINSLFKSPTLSVITAILGIGFLILLFIAIVSEGLLSSAYTASIRRY